VTEDINLTAVQKKFLSSICEKVAEFEARMNYTANPLTEEQQELLEAKFHNANRMRRWVD
jgi:hypothetical protein